MSDQAQPQPAPLNAAQLDAIQKRMIAEFQRAVDDVEMRKQAVDAACKIISVRSDIEPMGLVKSIYAFMAEPGASIVVDLKVT